MKHINLFFVFIVGSLILSGCAAQSPLIQASSSGDSSTVQKLLSEGANVNQPDGSGYTPLIYAIWSENIETVKVLLDKGADVNARDKSGYTPLLWSSYYGYLSIAKLLIDRGADVNARSNDNDTPYSFAIQGNFNELANLLKNKGANIKIVADMNLLMAIREKNTSASIQLIKSGADIYVKNEEGETALDIALHSAQGEIIDEIIRTGVNLWKPEVGKARLFFVGEGVWDYNSVYVGKQSKVLNSNKYFGMAFIDVEPGKHTVSVSEKPAKPIPITSIDTTAGQTYYLRVTQDMKRRIAHYALVKLSNVEIIPLKESDAKQKIKEILKSKEIK